MRKEVVFAIITGCILGIIIAFGIWRANLALSPNNKTLAIINNTKNTPHPANTNELAISKPENQSVITSLPLVIEGVTSPNSTLVIISDAQDNLDISQKDGSIKTEIDLSGGLNEIKIFSFDDKDKSSQKNLVLIYSSEIGKTETTTDSQSVENKVREKLEEKIKSPIAEIGIVTDITSSSIEIKSDQGDIKQISVDKAATSFVRIDEGKGSKTSKNINYSDMGIGDFIVAMGFKNNSNVLESKRILISPPFKSSPRTAFLGSVTKNAKNDFKVKAENQEWNIELSQKPKIIKKDQEKFITIKLSDLKEGDKLIISGSPSDKDQNSFIPRTVLKI